MNLILKLACAAWLPYARAAAPPGAGPEHRGIPELVEVLKTSSNMEEYVAAWDEMLAGYQRGADPTVLSGWEREWRAQIAAGGKDVKPFRLLLESYAWREDPALEDICRQAIRKFPRLPVFYRFFWERLAAKGDWPGLAASGAAYLRARDDVTASDYLGLADVYVRWERADLARDILAAARSDARLAAEQKAELADKLSVLGVLERSARGRPAAAECFLSKTESRLRLECGGESLSYEPQTGSFTGPRDPGSAAVLVQRLWERLGERNRPAAGAADPVLIPEDLREKLRQAGYLDR